MKFRIVEIKSKYTIPCYRPEYKTFLFWHRLSNTEWSDTIFCHHEFSTWEPGALESLSSAKKCIEDFKQWLGNTQESATVHSYEYIFLS